ncbi:MAG TPA: galactokinase family protein [Candidatus Sulfopaludibacter sp.]|jgi:galactokinase|nr:galactokinase family protein [Candidatus Sulfopaludibacter sp.]
MQERQGIVEAPGRVNLIGEHIDYHRLPVLPMALERRVRIDFRVRSDRRICACSEGYQNREFEWSNALTPVAAGDWENYLRAAARAVAEKWGVGVGVDAEIHSDLPPAAGLSSSSALIVAATLALLRANGIEASFEELMEVLPEGEHFVGTRGGGMDHAASLASRAGCASLIAFQPVSIRHIPIPEGWSFLVAHSGVTAEKSGAVRERYNARRKAGSTALAHFGVASYLEIPDGDVAAMAQSLKTVEEHDAFLHTMSEALRVRHAVQAMERGEAEWFGRLLVESHASLRDRLHVSCAALDHLVDAAMASGALGARLTGAGFGGCVVVFCREEDSERVRSGLAGFPSVWPVKAGRGALA